MRLEEKYENLKKYIKELGSAVIAFSGGVDSTFLAKVCKDVLNDSCLAVTATSSTYPEREFKEALELAKEIGIRHKIIKSEELEIEGFSKNPIDRCYYCKSELFSKLKKVADDEGIEYVLDGTNADDTGDFRPGRRAAKELGVKSPLLECGFTKDDIREMSKNLGLPTWNKPAYACLSSRFPYGQEITSEKLSMVEKSEEYLLKLGFVGFRVRHHGDIARIELNPDQINMMMDENIRKKVVSKLKEIGFKYVSLDLEGYRTGSMNEAISELINNVR
ncbi:ATP-dependent sacrificial sulfur transferase LarE [Thermoanaerobacterium thermosaccharolyticum]|uniref:ATP-dependent sacrificial sulfur transferase LarE n=1 Tax=Thermoanaerobacterium TaxID=28895 RepID=UPI0026E0E217|nr:ATP-dependent sacrificial sulfur transferase LarE [Thermoanaerobacterium sp. CMT5567-10]MDK2806057.1 pyridinium-3,5-biscarboxylic acid mononucleotide sulfurtransferase [Thermoanaerobacterium sp.]WHE08478.1 ATP-dependent sacrificial sulfur transferase LarE [Thermoanaerobacterium thermosaccharolyticum]WKV08663.1 ATP-dependent sacrificial sulfur transferase LarE [Thermoanaerobacterium sp. CMT5567-10]